MAVDYSDFNLISRVAAVIDPDSFERTEIEGDEQERAMFRAIQETRRVEARGKAKRILDLCRQQET